MREFFSIQNIWKEIVVGFLLVNPQSSAITKRAFEIFDSPIERLRQETQISLETLLDLRTKNPNLTAKMHDENSIIRFIYTEIFMFFSFFARKICYEDILNEKSTILEEI